jgi:hypothetical protein
MFGVLKRHAHDKYIVKGSDPLPSFLFRRSDPLPSFLFRPRPDLLAHWPRVRFNHILWDLTICAHL